MEETAALIAAAAASDEPKAIAPRPVAQFDQLQIGHESPPAG